MKRFSRKAALWRTGLAADYCSAASVNAEPIIGLAFTPLGSE